LLIYPQEFVITANLVLTGVSMSTANRTTIEVALKMSIAETMDGVSPAMVVIMSMEKTEVPDQQRRRLQQDKVEALDVEFEVQGLGDISDVEEAEAQLKDATSVDGGGDSMLAAIISRNGISGVAIRSAKTVVKSAPDRKGEDTGGDMDSDMDLDEQTSSGSTVPLIAGIVGTLAIYQNDIPVSRGTRRLHSAVQHVLVSRNA
jgi:hypothetical protein